MAKKILTKKSGKKEKKKTLKFVIDCALPLEDKVIVLSDFQKYLVGRIKVGGKVNNLGKAVAVENTKTGLTINAQEPFSKRYLKYLTKKYLKRHSLREFLYVIAVNKSTYQVKYFNIQQEGGNEE